MPVGFRRFLLFVDCDDLWVRQCETRARFWPRAGLLQTRLDTLPGGQLGQGAIVGIEVDVAGDTADRSSGADLPVGPGVVVAGGGTPAAVTTAGGPWVAGIQVAAIVVGNPCTQVRDAGGQVRRIAGADIDDRTQARRMSLEVCRPIIVPGGVGAFGAANTSEFFAIHHRHD